MEINGINGTGRKDKKPGTPFMPTLFPRHPQAYEAATKACHNDRRRQADGDGQTVVIC